MSEYRANTDIIRKSASAIAKAASDLGGIVGRVNGLANKIGGEYHGQLRDKVQPILSGLAGLGAQVSNLSDQVGVQLSAKATEIDAVMESSKLSAGNTLVTGTMSPIARFFNGLGQLTFGGVAAIIGGWIGLGKNSNHITTHIPTDPLPPTSPPQNNPQPNRVPAPPALQEADPNKYTSCALYAQARRPDLGPTGGDGGAYNYVDKFKNTDNSYQIPAGTTDLNTTPLRKGTAVVWEKSQQGSNKDYGHVAIIEDVGPDYVVVSESGWSSNGRRTIPIDKLSELHFIL